MRQIGAEWHSGKAPPSGLERTLQGFLDGLQERELHIKKEYLRRKLIIEETCKRLRGMVSRVSRSRSAPSDWRQAPISPAME